MHSYGQTTLPDDFRRFDGKIVEITLKSNPRPRSGKITEVDRNGFKINDIPYLRSQLASFRPIE